MVLYLDRKRIVPNSFVTHNSLCQVLEGRAASDDLCLSLLLYSVASISNSLGTCLYRLNSRFKREQYFELTIFGTN